MEDLIVVAILVLAIGAAVVYIIKEKKKGTKCIGCPAAGACSMKAAGGCSCCSDSERTEE